jgi:hypothetical protein
MKRWEITWFNAWQVDIMRNALYEGWEPFAVTGGVLYFRRLVEGEPVPQPLAMNHVYPAPFSAPGIEPYPPSDKRQSFPS